MARKWIGCLAALVATAGLAAADAPTSSDGDAAAPKATPAKPIPPNLPPAAAAPTPSVVLPPPPTAPCAACAASSPCAEKLVREACAAGCGCGCDDSYQIRTNVEYLLWWFKQDHVPMLLGTIPPALDGVNPLPPGSIRSVFGGDHDTLNNDGQSGARIGVEGFVDPQERFGLDANYFQLERGAQHASFASGPGGLPIIGPTFFDPTTGRENILLFSEPGFSTAALSVNSETRFWGAEANFRTRVPAVFSDRTELLLGFRTVQFDESLDVAGSSIALPGVTATFNGNPNALSFGYQDSFWVHDRFYGPQIGFDSESTYRGFFLNVIGKFAVGTMDQTVHIAGVTNFLAPAAFNVPGGVLAQRSNIGSYSHDVCTFLPEITVNAGVLIGAHARAFVGYNFLYIDELQRVGTAIDGVDARQIPALFAVPNATSTRPTFTTQDTRFWAQGLDFGLEFRY
ncbi:MAG TPA: BBP7 family outer membrane beta-barrel protein [Gemmataceae bacterium]|nr:BBP7 family outer membrane beta-barrel protein [Gemmataceae bacterium]